MDVHNNGAAPERLHGAENVTGGSLYDVFHELWS